MKKTTLLEFYALTVCFFSIVALLFSFSFIIWNGVGIIKPEFTLPEYIWKNHQSDEAFKQYLLSSACPYPQEEKKSKPSLPEGSALTTARNQSFMEALKAEKRSSVQNVLINLIILILASFSFIGHWKIGSKARING